MTAASCGFSFLTPSTRSLVMIPAVYWACVLKKKFKNLKEEKSIYFWLVCCVLASRSLWQSIGDEEWPAKSGPGPVPPSCPVQ